MRISIAAVLFDLNEDRQAAEILKTELANENHYLALMTINYLLYLQHPEAFAEQMHSLKDNKALTTDLKMAVRDYYVRLKQDEDKRTNLTFQHMTRSTYVYYLTMLGLLLGNCTGALAQQHKPQKPNIIYILMDDLGIGDVGVYYQNRRKAEQNRNHPYMQTPNIDGLAVSGAQLNQGYVNAPVCVASRASLLLGASQGQTKVRDNQFDKALDSNYNLANTLKRSRIYHCGHRQMGIAGQRKVWPASKEDRLRLLLWLYTP